LTSIIPARGSGDRRTTPEFVTHLSTMISDLDIHRAAHLLLERHGANALITAAQMIDRMLQNGDEEGRLVWLRIRRAVEALQAGPRGLLH